MSWKRWLRSCKEKLAAIPRERWEIGDMVLPLNTLLSRLEDRCLEEKTFHLHYKPRSLHGECQRNNKAPQKV